MCILAAYQFSQCKYIYGSPYFHGQSELMKFSNARPIYFIYWFITVETALNNKKVRSLNGSVIGVLILENLAPPT